MATVAYFVHGRGRGHASRAALAIPRLRAAGHRVVVFAGGDALDLLGREGVIEVSPVPVGLGALAVVARRLGQDLGAMREAGVEVVVSDGDAPGVQAGRRLGAPVIAVGHDQVFLGCALPPELPRGPLLAEQAVGKVTSVGASAAVAVHFLPIAARRAGTRVARPDRDPALDGAVRQEGPWVAYLRDGEGEDVLGAMVAAGARVTCFGRLRRPIAGVEGRAFARGEFLAALRAAPGVIATAGSNLLAECVMLGKPVLALHRSGDHEQRLNAWMAEQAGVAVAAEIGRGAAGVRVLLERAGRGEFARVDLEGALPPASAAIEAAVAEALAGALRARR